MLVPALRCQARAPVQSYREPLVVSRKIRWSQRAAPKNAEMTPDQEGCSKAAAAAYYSTIQACHSLSLSEEKKVTRGVKEKEREKREHKSAVANISLNVTFSSLHTRPPPQTGAPRKRLLASSYCWLGRRSTTDSERLEQERPSKSTALCCSEKAD